MISCNRCGLKKEVILSDGDISVCLPCHDGTSYEKGYNTALHRARVEIANAYLPKKSISLETIDTILVDMLIAKHKQWRSK